MTKGEVNFVGKLRVGSEYGSTDMPHDLFRSGHDLDLDLDLDQNFNMTF